MSGAPRVLMATSSTRFGGGAERYVEQAVAALRAHKVPVALFAEADDPADRPPLALPGDVPVWMGGGSLAEVRRWAPTLVLDNGVVDAELAEALHALAPVAFVTHNYLGACISGEKMHKLVTPRACGRPLGWPCLLHYYPNRCGGLDPRTMVRLWRRNRGQLSLVRRAAGVLVYSPHMAREFERHGVAPDRVRMAAPPVDAAGVVHEPAWPPSGEPRRLLFVGRFHVTKGARVLLDSLPAVARLLDAPVHLTLVGDGPERAALERRAARVARGPVDVRFTGWLPRERVRDEVAGHHLHVMPSVWPEPFGLVGLEAGALGLPTVAFDVGGIPDWLEDGVAGVLVRGLPRTGARLAVGIAQALADEGSWRRLCTGARDVARRHSAERFGESLLAAVTAWQGTSASASAPRARPAGMPAPN